MNILFINYEYPPIGGGGGMGTCQLAEEMAKNHTVSVITSSFKGLKESEIVNGVNIYRVQVLNRKDKDTATIVSMISFFPFSLLKCIKLTHKNKYDVINSHFVIPSGLTGIVLSKFYKIPHIMTIIGGDIYDPSKNLSPHKHKILNFLVTHLLKCSDKIVAISKDTKKRALQYYNNKLEIEIIPYGLPFPSYKKVNRNELGLNDKDFIMISVGRLVKRKGLDYLIQALSKIENKNVKLLIIGDGPEKNNLINMSKKLAIDSNVKFLGPIWNDEKYQYLNVSNAFVLPSLHEGFGIVFLEAMYCGLPIITTNNGGQTDFLVDEKNALLVPTENSDELARKIEILIYSNTLQSQMRKNNEASIKDYCITSTKKEYERVFKDASRNKINCK